MATVLIDANDLERGSLVPLLRRAGYSTVEAKGTGDALYKALDIDPDLIIVARQRLVEDDIYLPLLRRITNALVVVAGPDDEAIMSETLFRGADDYVPHSASENVMLARIRAALRQKINSRH